MRQDFAGVSVTVDDAGDRVLLEHDGKVLLALTPADVRVFDHAPRFDMQFGMFDIADPAGPQHQRRGKTFVRSGDDLSVAVVDDLGTLATLHFDEDDGGLWLRVDGSADVTELSAACTFKHAIGLGAQTHDVDHIGQTVPLWVSEQGIGKSDSDALPTLWQLLGRRHTTHVPMPAFVTEQNAALVIDTSAYAELDVCKDRKLRVQVWQPTLALRMFVGGSVRAAQAKMVDHLGRPAPLPPWAFAPWIDAIFGSDSVRARADALRAAGIPASALWSEDWRGGADQGAEQYRLDEDWDLDRALYPDFEQLLDDLAAQGLVSQVYFNTFLTQGGDVFDDALARGAAIANSDGEALLFSGPDRDFSPTALVDLTGDAGRAFALEHLEAALELGARGWMADYAEWMPVDGAVLASGEDPALVHNRYPVLWQQVNHDALAARGRLEDSVVFVRSGHLGSQPLVQVMWAGDQRTSFDADDGLPTVLPIGIGLSAVGFPVVTHDIGGYQSATNDPTTKELFLRWSTLGAFTPVMRTHHGTHARVNWNLFSDAETTATFKRLAELHVQLYPYLRALDLAATQEGGLPLWVPLPLLFPDDDDVWALKDEVLLGPSLLVAPVVEEGATSRAVVLPGARFAPFFDGVGAVTQGPATVTVDAAWDQIPVFVVAGGIVPMLAEPVDTLLPGVDGLRNLDDTEGDRLVVVGLGADGTFEEESGARYQLSGDGTAVPADDVVLVGDDTFPGEGFTFSVEGSPPHRTTRVRFR